MQVRGAYKEFVGEDAICKKNGKRNRRDTLSGEFLVGGWAWPCAFVKQMRNLQLKQKERTMWSKNHLVLSFLLLF